MDLSLPSDPRSRKLMGGAAFLIVVVGLYWWFMWRPAQAEITATATHANTLDSLNALAEAEVKKGTEAKLRAETDRYNSELVVLRRLVPTQNEVPALIDAISTAARMEGMDISELALDGTLVGDHFDAQKYKLAVTGPYHRVAEFFTAIGSLPRIVTPINVSLSTSSRVMERKPGKNETFVEAKFGVLTYVAKTVATPPPAPKPGGN